jgi:osmotically-inducible protein OsmY
MKNPWHAWILLGGCLCGVVALPLHAQAPPEPPQAAAPEQPGDAWITTRIRAALVPLQRDGHVDVRVATAAGVVTLEGSVDSPITRDRVVELATRVWGVRGVEAQALQVAGTTPYP